MAKKSIELTIEEFKKLFFGNTNLEMGKQLGVSEVTIGNHARKLGLRKRPAYARNKIKIVG